MISFKINYFLSTIRAVFMLSMPLLNTKEVKMMLIVANDDYEVVWSIALQANCTICGR
jgi:hypothetical protein